MDAAPSGAVCVRPMCNLYSLTKGQAAIRDWFRASHDRTGNLPLFPGIFPAARTASAASDLRIYVERRKLELSAIVAR